jgi:hypothetical protein
MFVSFVRLPCSSLVLHLPACGLLSQANSSLESVKATIRMCLADSKYNTASEIVILHHKMLLQSGHQWLLQCFPSVLNRLNLGHLPYLPFPGM